MKGLRTYGLVAAAMLLNPVTPVLAENYWASTYRDYDVVVADRVGGTRALTLAGDVARFHNALTQILRSPQRQLPTHIYELPSKVLKALTGYAGSTYFFDGYETTVLSDADSDARDGEWGALFGYTGSYLLSSGGFARYPYWFLTGVPAVFANTQFELSHVRTGYVVSGYGWTLSQSPFIPMRVFLRVHGGDPQLQSPTFRQMYDAESWYLAREVLLENRLRPEFEHYWALIQSGKSEEDAFSESFKLSYEDLDKLLRNAMSDPVHVYIVNAPPQPLENPHTTQLSNADVDALLAQLSFRWRHYPDALRFASQALAEDPANELALRTLGQEKLREGDFNAALAAVDKLAAVRLPSDATLTDSGEVLARLASEVSLGHASLTVDAASLRDRAKTSYEHAISLDPEYLRAWEGLATLYSQPAAAADARALLPRVQPVMEKHSYSGRLARALTVMCARTAQASCAFLFGEFWKSDAINDEDRDRATAFLASMEAQKAKTQ